jgi:hypothetical protein
MRGDTYRRTPVAGSLALTIDMKGYRRDGEKSCCLVGRLAAGTRAPTVSALAFPAHAHGIVMLVSITVKLCEPV